MHVPCELQMESDMETEKKACAKAGSHKMQCTILTQSPWNTTNKAGKEQQSILRLCGGRQGYLAKLGMSNLVSVGMLSINVLFGNSIQVSALDFLPNLEAVTGIPTGVQLPPASSSCS